MTTNPLKRFFRQPPGTPYVPANGDEGIDFEEAFCENCMKEDPECDSWCIIHADAMIGAKPTEWTHDKDGIPCCTAWEEREEK